MRKREAEDLRGVERRGIERGFKQMTPEDLKCKGAWQDLTPSCSVGIVETR